MQRLLSPAIHRVIGDLMSYLQDLIPKVIHSQKYHISICLILKSYGFIMTGMLTK
jgi:hypothetical protein